MRKLLAASLMIACVGAGCRLPVPDGIADEQREDAEDTINGFLCLMATGAILTFVGLMVDPPAGAKEDAVDPEAAARIKAQLDADRAQQSKAKRPGVYEAWIESVNDRERTTAAQAADATWIDAAIEAERQRRNDDGAGAR